MKINVTVEFDKEARRAFESRFSLPATYDNIRMTVISELQMWIMDMQAEMDERKESR